MSYVPGSLTVTLDGEDVTGDLLFNSITLPPTEAPLLGTFTRTASGGVVHSWSTSAPWPIPEWIITREDQAIINGFLIDSFARGFAKNGA